MEIFWYISLISSLIFIFMGSFVFSKAPGNRFNRLFFFLSLAMAFAAFSEAELRRSPDIETALFWIKMGAFGWPIVLGLFLHFSIFFAQQKRRLPDIVVYSLIYIPAIVFLLVDFFTDKITLGAAKKYWGWTFIRAEGVVNDIVNAWIIIVVLVSLYYIVKVYVKTTDYKKKVEMGYILAGCIVIILVGIISEIIIPSYEKSIPEMTVTSYIISNFLFAIAILKYRFFVLTPATASDDIISTMRDFLLLINDQGVIQSVNKATEIITGYNDKELISRNIDILLKRDRQEKKIDLFTYMEIMKTFTDTEINIRRKSGDRLPVSLSVSEIRDRRDNFIGLVCTGRDISERRASQEMLSESQDKAKAFLSVPTDGVVMLDTNGIILHANDTMAARFGKRIDEIIGSNILELFDKEAADKVEDVIKKVLDHKKPIRHDDKYKDSYYDNLIYPIFDENHRVKHIVIYAHDITNRKNAEQLIEYRLRFEKTINDISRKFIDVKSDKLDKEIEKALAIIGDFVDADTCYLYKFYDNPARASKSHEWCRSGISSTKDIMQNISTDSYSYLLKKAMDFKTIYIPSVDKMSAKSQNEKEVFLNLGIKSILMIPLIYGRKTLGVLGFNSFYVEMSWQDEDIELLKTVSDLFVNAVMRKETEQSLRDQLYLSQSLIDTIPFPIFYKNADGEFLGCNKAYEKYINFQKDDIIGKTIFDLLPTDFAKIYHEKDQKILKSGKSDNFEISVINSDWSISNVVFNQTVFYRSDGNVGGIVGVIVDITEQTQMAEALKATSEEQSLLLDNIETQIWYLTNVTTYGIVNNARANFLGKNKREIQYKSIYDVVDDDEAETLISGNRQVYEQKTQTRTQDYFRNSDGEIRLLNIIRTPKMDNNDNIEYIICTAEDITEQKIAEEKLKSYTKHIEYDLQRKNISLLKAQSIQQSLITGKLPNIKDINLAAFYMPSEEIGGDYFEVRYIDDKLIIIIADCTGHGIEASLDSVLLKSVVDRYPDFLINCETEKFLQAINEDIYIYFKGKNYLTILACVIDAKTKKMYYSNANNEMPFMIKDGTTTRLPRAEGFFIGYDKHQEFEQKVVDFDENTILFFYSDAIKELKDAKGDMLGISGIQRIVKNFGNGLDNDLDFLLSTLESINGKLPLDDDTTAILLENTPQFHKKYMVYNKDECKQSKEELRQKLGYFDYRNVDINRILVSYEEMYLNALVHGNRNNGDIHVDIEISVDCEKTEIAIKDQGNGFDPDALPDPTDINRLKELLKNDQEEIYIHGRGVSLTKKYMDYVEYTENGSRVKIVKHRQNKETLFSKTKSPEKLSEPESMPLNDETIMISWTPVIEEDEIIKLNYKGIFIDFGDTLLLKSSEIAQLLRIYKHCNDKNISLVFNVESTYLKELLLEQGFKKLGIVIGS